MSKSKSYQILFQLSGSIACYKACAAISQLTQLGHDVRAVATRSTFEFVGRATLEGLTGQPVFHDLYEDGRQMDHIYLARWADILVLAPATAHTLNSLAAGLSDSPIGSLFLANNFKKPYLIAPAMNTEMLAHPATQNSIQQLKKWGSTILESPKGALACGESGSGRMIEPQDLVKAIEKILKGSKK